MASRVFKICWLVVDAILPTEENLKSYAEAHGQIVIAVLRRTQCFSKIVSAFFFWS
jgi:hypothetical protein